jgi:hypothetical protein
MDNKPLVDRKAELLDVQLLDVLAQVEAILRHGREVQREALRIRGVPSPVNQSQRRAAATALRDRVDLMHGDCGTLCEVMEDLRAAANELKHLLGTRR